jgi:hypothetical protein
MKSIKMKCQKPILLSITLCIFLLIACSEMDTKWTRRFNALGPGSYRISSITNTKEDIYCTGTHMDQNNRSTCFLAKFSSNGNPEWHEIFQTTETTQAQGKALLIMSKQEELLTTRKDICLLVETQDENGVQKAILAKYDTLGNLVWQKTATVCQGILTSNLLYDSNGNLYVAGWQEDTEGKHTIFIVKYSESGVVLYATKYYSEGLDFNDLRFDIVEPECFVLAGLLPNSNELFYIKYNSAGQFQRMVKHKTETTINVLRDLKISPEGYVFMGANILNVETGADFVTFAFNSEDSLLWVAEYDGGAHGDDHSKAIAVDESLNVYVTGSTANTKGIPNIVTVKYDISGTRLWAKHISQEQASEPLIMEPRYLRLGESPHRVYLYIAGKTGNRALILRCNTNGIYSFRAQYGEGKRVAVPTALSEKCMAFELETESGADAFITKYGPSAILGIARWD